MIISFRLILTSHSGNNFVFSFQMKQKVISEPEIVPENLVSRPRPVSRGKILSWEADDEDREAEEDRGGSPSPPQLDFPSRGFDQRRYLKQLSTNTKDLDTIEPR